MIDLIKKNKLVFLILVLGAFLRFYRISAYTEFLGDQGRDVLRIRQFVKDGDFMLIGPQTSIGNMYLGPWYYYLITPSLVLANFNPLGPALFNGLIGLFTIWLIYRFGSQWFGKETGFWAAGLLALSPAVIKYSNFIWNPNVLPLFSLVSMWFLWRVWKKDDYKSLIWLAASLAMVLNSHYLGLLLFPVIAIFLMIKFFNLFKQKNVNNFLKFGLVGLGVFMLLMSPLIVFDIKHGFPNFNAFLTFFTQRQTTVNFKFYKGLFDFNQVYNQFISQFLIMKDTWRWSLLLLPVILLGIWKERKIKTTWLIITWLIIGLIGIANYKQHVYAHYYLFLYPSLALLISLGITKLNYIKFLFGFGIMTLMIFNWHGWNPPNNQLTRTRKIAHFICSQIPSGENYNIVNLASYGDYRALAYRYFLVNNCPNKPMADSDYPQADYLYVIQESPEKYPDPIESEVWEIQSGDDWKIKSDWEAEGIPIYKLGKIK